MSGNDKKELNLQEIKSMQLEIMDEIHSYCVENKLTYFLVGGTLLGAIRHGGFIPWDDDIDIALPRDDYEKLIDNFVSRSGNVSVINIDNYRKYCWTHAKAVHNKTELVENTSGKCNIGVFIDIFPLDKVFGDRENGIDMIKKVSRWKNILTLKHLKVDRKRSFAKNVIVICGKIFNVFSDRFIIKKVDVLSKLADKTDKPKYVCNFSGAWGIRELASSLDFGFAELHKFEDREYYIPTGYNSYLTTVYGDYMTPPPIEKQHTHHDYKAYLK